MNCYDRAARLLRCAGCGAVKPLFSHSLDNPERFMAGVLEPFLQEHAKCESYKDQMRARRELRWRRSMNALKQRAGREDGTRNVTGKRYLAKSNQAAGQPAAICEAPAVQDVEVIVAHAQIEALAKRWGARLA